MGFLSDFTKGMKTVNKALEAKEQATAKPKKSAVTVEATISKPGRTAKYDWATPEEYDPIPPLILRNRDETEDGEGGWSGYGFQFPDGRWLHPGRLGIRRWKKVGVFHIEIAGSSFHLEDLADPSFTPGQPLRLEAEPDNPHSEEGTAIAVRNWANDKTGGYVPHDLTGKVRSMTADEPFHTMVLIARYGPKDGRIARLFIEFVIFRPGRIAGLADFPMNPPVAPPRDG